MNNDDDFGSAGAAHRRSMLPSLSTSSRSVDFKDMKLLLTCAAVLFLDGSTPRPIRAMSRRFWQKNGA